MKAFCIARRLLLPFFLTLSALAHALDVGVSHVVYSDGAAPYVEINIEIAASSATFRAVDSIHLKASVETLILIKQGEKVVNYEKYILNSPITERPETLLDVKRLALPNGEYDLEITFQDVNDPENKDTYQASLKVGLTNALHLTEIQLLRLYYEDASEGNPFTKNGYYMEPLPFRFYDRQAVKLVYYAEIYNVDQATKEEYTVRSVIEQQLGNGLSKLVTVGAQRKMPVAMDGVLIQMDISKMGSGNYSLKVELRNKQGEVMAYRLIEFQRSNPFLDLAKTEITDEMLEKQFVQNFDEEKLRYALRAAAPNVGNEEAESLKLILKGSDLKAMRFFLFNFFAKRDPNNPEMAYLRYMETARAADNQFKSGFRLGFESDRGRTYMRFGRPDDIIHVEDDPAAPPYEIWIYYDFPKTKQRNVKFLFYNPSLAGEDYIVLHSTARGEINNPRWERELYRRNAGQEFNGDNYHDATEMQGNNNRNARRYFEDF